LKLLLASPDLARVLDLGPSSRVLLINTEGATAPSVYAQLVGEQADAVLDRQRAWRAQGAVAPEYIAAFKR